MAERILAVIPCFNEEHTIGALAQDLATATQNLPMRIVIADGGSTDRTQDIAEQITQQHANMSFMHNPKRLQAAAINLAVATHGADAEYLIRLDAHADYARALALGAKLTLTPKQGYVSVLRANSLSGQHSEQDLLNLRDCDDDLARIPGLTAQDKEALQRHQRSVDCRLQWRLLINAVKAGDARAGIATFMRPWPVPAYLVSRLAEQAVLRASKKMKGQR